MMAANFFQNARAGLFCAVKCQEPARNDWSASVLACIVAQNSNLDGWESRRRRTPGFDWCIIRIGLPGVISGVVVDTSHFKGNYPESCSLEAVAIDGLPTIQQLTSDSLQWTEILPQSNLNGDSLN